MDVRLTKISNKFINILVSVVTYIDDVIDANHSLLTDDSADGETMNIGSTDNIDTTTLAEVVRDEMDPTLDIEYTEARDGDAEHTHADISKARSSR